MALEKGNINIESAGKPSTYHEPRFWGHDKAICLVASWVEREVLAAKFELGPLLFRYQELLVHAQRGV